MLTENQVVEAVAEWLKSDGYDVIQVRKETSKGHDIIAKNSDDNSLYIECKGSKSLKNRKNFSMTYKWRCASGALFNQLKLRLGEPTVLVGIAVPDDSDYRDLFSGLESFLKTNGIQMYWVKEDGSIALEDADNPSLH